MTEPVQSTTTVSATPSSPSTSRLSCDSFLQRSGIHTANPDDTDQVLNVRLALLRFNFNKRGDPLTIGISGVLIFFHILWLTADVTLFKAGCIDGEFSKKDFGPDCHLPVVLDPITLEFILFLMYLCVVFWNSLYFYSFPSELRDDPLPWSLKIQWLLHVTVIPFILVMTVYMLFLIGNKDTHYHLSRFQRWMFDYQIIVAITWVSVTLVPIRLRQVVHGIGIVQLYPTVLYAYQTFYLTNDPHVRVLKQFTLMFKYEGYMIYTIFFTICCIVWWFIWVIIHYWMSYKDGQYILWKKRAVVPDSVAKPTTSKETTNPAETQASVENKV